MRSLPYQLVGIATFLLLPTLGFGFFFDDLLHKLVVERKLAVPIGPLDLFDFLSSQTSATSTELGLRTWWIPPETKMDYYRPLAALSHFIDYSYWPRWAWLMHLENVAWYVIVVFAAAVFYRRFIRTAWVAGLAASLYAIDHFHSVPVSWIANRCAIMSVAFGLLSLLSHDRWRRTGTQGYAAVAATLFAMALLSAEIGLSIVGYLAAYALCIDRGSRIERVRSMMPYAFVAIVWRAIYRILGYGLARSGIGVDPVLDPGAYFQRAIQSIPVALAGQLYGLPTDGAAITPLAFAVVAAAALALVVFTARTLQPLLRRDASARFFAVGALMSALPLGAMMPTDRYLLWLGLGGMGLVAQWTQAVLEPSADIVISRAGRWACAAAVAVHAVLSPLVFPFRAVPLAALHDQCAHVAAMLSSGTDVPRRTVVVLNAPFEFLAMFLPIMQINSHRPVPAHLYVLYSGLDDISVSRLDRRTLEINSSGGWLAGIAVRTFRGAQFHVGDAVNLARVRAEVRGVTADGRPDDVAFTFDSDLDAPLLDFFVWGSNGLERIDPPRIGNVTEVSEPPTALTLMKALVAHSTTPHLRRRAIED